MKLEGSCHCRAVRFTVESKHAHPFMLCYCSICRKTQGGGGYAINLSGDSSTLKIRGKQHLRVYRAMVKNPEDKRGTRSTGQRNFCGKCGSALWLYDPTWPELVHPLASAIDSELPVPPERTHIMLDFKPAWVELRADKQDKKFKRYPEESIAQWHDRVGVTGQVAKKTRARRKK